MGNSINEIISCLNFDNSDKLQNLIKNKNIQLNQTFTNHNRTLIQLSCYYGAKNCLKTLINLGNDFNIPETQNNDTPLIVSSKFNFIELVKILLAQENINYSLKNYNNLNCLDMAICRGNYEIALYILENTTLKIEKSLDQYIDINNRLKYPLFEIEPFYSCLIDKIPLDKCPSFKLQNTRKKNMIGKLPDPNESWSDFLKRLGRLELFLPPMIDKNLVQDRNSLYMRTQTKLIEDEYGIDLDIDNKKDQIKYEKVEDNKSEILNNDTSKKRIHTYEGNYNINNLISDKNNEGVQSNDIINENVKENVIETELINVPIKESQNSEE
jgi:hypothetical protein